MAAPTSILSSVKTFSLIAFITVLVWLLAEAESLRTDKVQVRVAFRSGSDATLVRAEPGQDFNGTVTIRLEGPTARVDALASALNKKEIVLEPGSEGVPAGPGHPTVALSTALRALPAIRDSGVSVVDTDPPTASIWVENLVVREAKVRIDLPDGQSLETVPEPSPATVRVRLPENVLQSLPQELTVPVPIDPDALKSLPEGVRSSVKAAVELPESLRNLEGVKVTPATIDVKLTLRAKTAMLTIPTVPVHLRLAPTEIGLWDIQVPENSRQLTDVVVSGPSDRIAEIKSGAAKPIAFVPLSFEELEKAAASGQPLDKEPIFSDLPTSLKFDAKQKTIRLVVKRRETPSGSPSPAPVTGKGPQS